MKLSNAELVEKLKWLGLVSIDTNKPVSYTGFKNMASVHKYGKDFKIVFIGHPKENLFGFYTMCSPDTQVMKEAYDMFVDMVNGKMDDYNDNNVQWGNNGIPLSYKSLSQVYQIK